MSPCIGITSTIKSLSLNQSNHMISTGGDVTASLLLLTPQNAIDSTDDMSSASVCLVLIFGWVCLFSHIKVT